MMKEVAREFLGKLESEDRVFSDRLKGDTMGVMLLTAIKEFDFYYYNLMRNPSTEEASHHFDLIRYGIPRVISKVLSEHAQFIYPVITFKSDSLMIKGSLEAVAAFGLIEQGKRLAHAVMAGECELRLVDDRQYDFILPDIMHNLEAHEAEVEQHYDRLQTLRYDKAVEEMLVKSDATTRIQTLLMKNVYAFRGTFIGYNSHPDLDAFFFGKAALEIQSQRGYDTFNGKLQFGGVTFQKYILATIYFLSLSRKHEQFAAALLKKAPNIRLRDILTITCDKREFRASLLDALNSFGPSFDGYTTLTDVEADTILNVLSVRRENLAVILPTMASLPFLIEFSSTAWVKSIAAVQLGAMDFLLNSLKYNFSADYVRHKQTCEHSMQRALKGLISDFIPGLVYMDNITLRQHGKTLTDIDFAVADEADGTLLLFQLKHQDHYGADMRKRSSRAEHLRNKCASWLSAVRDWLGRCTESEIRSSLRLKGSFRLQAPRIVFLTRHFAHFLSDLDLQNDTAYATWIQMFDALNRLRTEGRPLTIISLFDLLKAYMSHNMERGHPFEMVDTYHLENLSYRIRPRSAVKDEPLAA